MSVAFWIAMTMLATAVGLGLVRIITAKDAATRAVVGDLVFFGCIGILVIIGVMLDSAVTTDAAMLASILGVVATVALGRILTRGHR